jgi:predicted deacetylase
MSMWLDGLQRALDEAPRPVAFYFRDDDAGWDDEGLFDLLDLFARHSMPVDLAVIPRALTPGLASRLRAKVEAAPHLIAVHQHGYAHLNHEPEGRKCEFGASRTREQQLRDIEAGKARLNELCGPIVNSIFTPPWNRCTTVTGDCLRSAGFQILSRDATAEPLNVEGLFELPVSVDWFARRKGVRLSAHDFGAMLAASAATDPAVGVMFHHAPMDAAERRRAGELLALVASHRNACARLMGALAAERSSGAAKQISTRIRDCRQPATSAPAHAERG